MRLAFEVSKLCFLVVILCIAVLQYTGADLMDVERQEAFIKLLLPAFFVFGGVMLWRLLALFFAQEMDPPEHILARWFIAGLMIGICIVVLYFFWIVWTV